MFCYLLGYLGICHMFLCQNVYVVGFVYFFFLGRVLYIMSWVLSYPAYAVRYVFWLMVASGNCGYVVA